VGRGSAWCDHVAGAAQSADHHRRHATIRLYLPLARRHRAPGVAVTSEGRRPATGAPSASTPMSTRLAARYPCTASRAGIREDVAQHAFLALGELATVLQ